LPPPLLLLLPQRPSGAAIHPQRHGTGHALEGQPAQGRAAGCSGSGEPSGHQPYHLQVQPAW
jgi:hypothetical protein